MSRKILIVDDARTNRLVLAKTLQNDGYELHEASNGQEALDLADTISFDLVILDIIMPVLDGVETCKRLKKRSQFIPVIVSTALDSRRNDEILEAGADDILHRPFADAVLRMRVSSYLRLKEYYDKLVIEQKRISALAMAVTANHEINQPLMILAGNLEMLETHMKDCEASEPAQRYVKNIHNAVGRIQRILDRFKRSTDVEFSEYSAGTAMAELTEDLEDDDVF